MAAQEEVDRAGLVAVQGLDLGPDLVPAVRIAPLRTECLIIARAWSGARFSCLFSATSCPVRV